MKRLVAALVLLVTMLALVLAYGVERQSADETKGTGSSQETQPMVATTPSPAVGLQEQLDELVLGEGDVPAGFHTLLNTDMDFDPDLLAVPIPEGTTAHVSMLLAPNSQKTIMSIAGCCQDDTAMEKAFSDKDDLNIEQMDEAFNMMSDAQRHGQTRLDTRELDVSALGELAYGLGSTTEMGDGRVLDQEMVAFGKGSVIGIIMTAALDGVAPDAVSLAQTMADKIEAAESAVQ
jgi:hypothetical protein